jgi:hypothetical protein
MKNLFGITILVFVLAACGTTSDAPSGQGSTSRSGRSSSSAVYFTGDGGKGLRLAVLEPVGKGLSANEQWMLSLVQGSLTADINRFSAITVADRQNLETVLAEQSQALSGNYSDDDYISIGRLTNARLVLAGAVTRTANGYMLELAVTDVESGERKASYPPTPVSPSDMENLSAVREATADLLTQLGVTLTDEGRQQLEAPAAAQQVQAQTSLARGITAGKQGTIVEALNYFSEAVSFDSGLAEANQRLNGLTQQIQSGNIGDNIRNEIDRRNAWAKLLEEAVTFYNANPYFDIVYNTKPEQGRIDFNRNTGQIEFPFWLEPNGRADAVRLLLKALEDTGKESEWGLSDLARQLYSSTSRPGSMAQYYIRVGAELLDDNNVLLGEASSLTYIEWEYENKAYGTVRFNTLGIPTSKTADAKLTFTVAADKISDRMLLQFPVIGVASGQSGVRANMSENARVIATDKTYEQYFTNRPRFRKPRAAPHPQDSMGFIYTFR